MRLKWADFLPVFRARTQRGMKPMNPARIYSIQVREGRRWGWRERGGRGAGGAGAAVKEARELPALRKRLDMIPTLPTPPPPQLMLSKFEADGAVNPTFREGRFELPVQRISGGWHGWLPGVLAAYGASKCSLPSRQVGQRVALIATLLLPSPSPPQPRSLPAGRHACALRACEQRRRDAPQPPWD